MLSSPSPMYFWRKVGFEANRREAAASSQEESERWCRVSRYAAKRYNIAAEKAMWSHVVIDIIHQEREGQC